MATKESQRAASARYRAAHPDRVRAQARSWRVSSNPAFLLYQKKLHLKKYGVTPEQYDAMLVAQGGHCAICPAIEPGRGNRLFHVDHDHTTGQVRGLLCLKCNVGIGQLRDDADLLERAAAYLRRARG